VAETAARTGLVRSRTTKLRERREKETYVPREAADPIRRAERDDLPGMRPFAENQTNDEPKELAAFAAGPDDTPPPPLPNWKSRST
jgi:hypothetical protein